MTVLVTWWIGLATAAEPGLDALLAAELQRAMTAWEASGDPDDVPHHVAVAVTDREGVRLAASAGALTERTTGRRRWLDVDLRLGTPELDSTHPLRGMSAFDDDTRVEVRVPWAGDGTDLALRHALWRELDRAWRDARERLVLVRVDQAVRVEEEDPAPDFEPRGAGVIDRREVPALAIDVDAWADTLREVSTVLDASPVVVQAEARLDASREVVTYVDSEGARLVHGRVLLRVSVGAEAVADDGDRVTVHRAVDARTSDGLPDAAGLRALAREVVAEVEALRRAPRATPYTGPVLLSGKAAAVFFHEVLGHRAEGHRNKSEDEGKTFLDHLGRPVLPPFVDVVDDPTLERLDDVDLRGWYAYDDEGVPAEPAVLVEKGVFRGFLTSRSPLAAFPRSNGHGRRSPGHPPVARMGNTLVRVTDPVDDGRLRAMLLDEVRAQGLSYGYVVEEIDGGFTLTGRVVPNAFNVRASRTVRVWADGRPDELVRGIDLVGTPLVAFRSLVAGGRQVEVFNGTCGAESGWVPVSAAAPPLLFRRLEFQLKEKASDRPPLLLKPGHDGDGTAEAP